MYRFFIKGDDELNTLNTEHYKWQSQHILHICRNDPANSRSVGRSTRGSSSRVVVVVWRVMRMVKRERERVMMTMPVSHYYYSAFPMPIGMNE